MLRIFFIIFFLPWFNILQVLAETNYSSSAIPEDLKKDAIAVIRKNNSTLIIESPARVTLKTQYAITILSDKGKDYGNIYIVYDKFSQIKNISGNVYSKDGIQIRKIRNSDLGDHSYYPDYTLYSDTRLKYIEITENNFPYTIEYEYEIGYDGMVGYPLWQPVRFYNISVEQSELKVVLKPGMTFHYREKNLPAGAEIIETENGIQYCWRVNNISALVREPFSSSLVDFTPVVYLAPDQFYYDGFHGDMSNWTNYGSWLYDLIESRNVLPEETINEIKRLVSVATNDKEKARIIYEYMQSKTRYVSIQLGIGGLQPFPAADVDKIGYGDCKALSNYTKALLSVAGIKSFYAIIGSGTEYEIKFDDFSSANQANHAILCTILENDTVWLECTNQKIPFGYIGQNSSDRKALLITEEGGKIVTTTKYPIEINSQLRTASVKLYEENHAEAKVKTVYSGFQYENVKGIFNASFKEQKDYLYQNLSLNNFEITDFNYLEKKDIIPEVTENISLKINNYASHSGNRLIVPLNFLNRWNFFPDSTRKRKSNILFRISNYDIDTIRYIIPSNYIIDFLPEDQRFVSDFGEYSYSIRFNDHILTYSRHLKIYKGNYSPEKYDEFIDFFSNISKNDNCKAILLKED
jgi:hypothetical protein